MALSGLALAQHKPHAAYRVDQSISGIGIHLLTEAGHLDVDDVVQRRGTSRLFPDLPCQHFSRNQMPLMAQQVFEELELTRGQVEEALPTDGAACDQIHLEVRRLQAKRFQGSASAQQRS